MPATLQSTSFTIVELRDIVRGDIGLRGSNFLVDADIDRWSKDVIRQAAEATHYYQVTDTADATADVAEYSLPAGCIALIALAHNQLPLDPINHDDLMKYDPWWRQTGSGIPYCWYTRGTTAYGLYPTPSTTIVNGVQRLYAAIPAMPTTGAFSFPTANEQLIIDYCCFRAAMKDATGEGGKRVDRYEKMYLQQMERLKQSVSDTGEGQLLVMGGDSGLRRRSWRDIIDRAVIPAPV